MRIAFLDDDPAFLQQVTQWLVDGGHVVDAFSSGRALVKAVENEIYDLCLLDWMVPDLSGPEVMIYLKLKTRMPPVVFLTARDAEEDVVLAMHAGADDYIAKPPSREVLLARLAALGRRSAPARPDAPQRYGNLMVDFARRTFSVDHETIHLTEKETALALLFFSRLGQLISREQLIEDVWGGDADGGNRTVDVHVSHLRSKLKLVHEHGWRLGSVYRRGYRLERLEDYSSMPAMPA
jgi:DNA-binding response OmpR family regulator